MPASRKTSRDRGQEAVPDFAGQRGGRSPETDVLDFAWRLLVAARRYKSQIDDTLAAHGFTHARFEVLAALDLAPEGITQGQLAKFMRIEGPTLVRLLNRLEQEGLVRRLPSGADRRTKGIGLTERGRESVRRLEPVVEERRLRILDTLTGKDIAEGTRVLDEVLKRLDHFYGMRR